MRLRAAPLLLVLLLAACANGYKEFYHPAPGAAAVTASRASPPPATPIVERAQPTSPQVIVDAYARRGYSMIGNSSFNSGRSESDSKAIEQGKRVGADLVLILNPRYTGSVTTSVPITTPTTSTTYSTGTATAYGSGGSVTAYGSGTSTTYGTSTNYVPVTINRSDYGAVYFVKQKLSLGVYTRELNNSERQEMQTNKGVVITVVANDSAAFNADILVGDVVTAIDGVPVTTKDSFTSLLRERHGQEIKMSITRHGQKMEKSVQLPG